MQALLTEVYKIVRGEELIIMKNLFLATENVCITQTFHTKANEIKNTI